MTDNKLDTSKIIDNIDKAIKDGKNTVKELSIRKQRLIGYIDFLGDDQIRCFEVLLDMGNIPFNKHEIVKFIKSSNIKPDEVTKFGDTEILTNYDTAYPINYIKEIEQIYPDATKGNFVYDYSNLSFGRLINLNNSFVSALYKLMNN